MLKKIKVLGYELWGNDDDGWDCNNVLEICKPIIVNIPDDCYGSKVLELLQGKQISIFQLTHTVTDTLDFSTLEVDNNCDMEHSIELVEKGTGKPSGRLVFEELSNDEIADFVDNMTIEEINQSAKTHLFENQYGYCQIADINGIAFGVAHVSNIGIFQLTDIGAIDTCFSYDENLQGYIEGTVEPYLKAEFEKDTDIFILPAFWASLLINGDMAGYTDDEIAEIDAWTKANTTDICCGCSDDSFFAHQNDANSLGCDCLEFYFPKAKRADND